MAKRSKYGNTQVESIHGNFDSRKEYVRFLELNEMLKKKKIKNLELQPSFLLQDGFVGYLNGVKKNIKPIHYIADFKYEDIHGVTIIEDVKGMKTKEYIIKSKIFLKIYGAELNFYEI